MILKLENLENRIEYLELNKIKNYMKDNLKKIFDDILSNKNLEDLEIEKELKFEKIKNQKLYQYNIENRKSKLYIDNLDNQIYFILREIELNNYFEKNLMKDISKLKIDEIIKKLDDYDFMIIEYNEKKFIILFHKDNDFKIR